MNRNVLICFLLFFLTAGCSKKTKETVPDTTPPPPLTHTSSPKLAPGPPGGGSAGVPPSGGSAVAETPSRTVGAGRSGGLVQNTRQAVRRTEALNEMRTLGQEISLLLSELGRMPTKDQIQAALKTNSKLLTAINEGIYILTGTTDAGGLWAYEVDADVIPGIALIGGTAAKSMPEELARYFPKK